MRTVLKPIENLTCSFSTIRKKINKNKEKFIKSSFLQLNYSSQNQISLSSQTSDIRCNEIDKDKNNKSKMNLKKNKYINIIQNCLKKNKKYQDQKAVTKQNYVSQLNHHNDQQSFEQENQKPFCDASQYSNLQDQNNKIQLNSAMLYQNIEIQKDIKANNQVLQQKIRFELVKKQKQEDKISIQRFQCHSQNDLPNIKHLQTQEKENNKDVYKIFQYIKDQYMNSYNFKPFMQKKTQNCKSLNIINIPFRSKMISWLIEISYKLKKMTFAQLFRGISIMDRFLIHIDSYKNLLKIQDIHLIGICSLYIAHKYETKNHYQLNLFLAHILKNKFSANTFICKELEILQIINFDLEYKTSLDILGIIFSQTSIHKCDFLQKIYNICCYSLNVCLFEIDFIIYYESETLAICIIYFVLAQLKISSTQIEIKELLPIIDQYLVLIGNLKVKQCLSKIFMINSIYQNDSQNQFTNLKSLGIKYSVWK